MEEQRIDTPEAAGTLHIPGAPNRDGIILTHGAGSDSNSGLLVSLARSFCEAGYHVLRYDLAFRRTGRPPHPSHAARDRESVANAAALLRTHAPGRLIAGGHSYGGRQTAMAASENPALADSLLLLSYPLHPPDKPDQLRNQFFPQLRTPALFVHGVRDPFGTIEELQTNLALIPAATRLLPVERSAHDLKRATTLTGEILQRMLF